MSCTMGQVNDTFGTALALLHAKSGVLNDRADDEEILTSNNAKNGGSIKSAQERHRSHRERHTSQLSERGCV